MGLTHLQESPGNPGGFFPFPAPCLLSFFSFLETGFHVANPGLELLSRGSKNWDKCMRHPSQLLWTFENDSGVRSGRSAVWRTEELRIHWRGALSLGWHIWENLGPAANHSSHIRWSRSASTFWVFYSSWEAGSIYSWILAGPVLPELMCSEPVYQDQDQRCWLVCRKQSH